MSQSSLEQSLDLAVQHHRAGRLRDAEIIYQQILAQAPSHLAAIHYLASLAHQTGRDDMAINLFSRAISLKPDWAEAYSNLANVLTVQGRFDEAIVVAQRAIALRPEYPEAHNNLANAFNAKHLPDDAINAARRAIALKPDFAEAFNNLGNALTAKGLLPDAIVAHLQAIRFNPCLAEAHNNLGNALQRHGKLSDAAIAYRQAIALRPNYAKAFCNLGNVLRDTGQHAEAVAYFHQAIALQPQLAEAHGNLATVLLAQEDYAQGWSEYEWRWQCEDFSASEQIFSHPRWDGSPLDGKTILLHTEQGLGDAIQFGRYVPLVAERGGNVIIQCQGKLHRLFQTIQPSCLIVSRGQPLPPFDLHCPLMSLPLIFRTAVSTIPNTIPYLKSDPLLVDSWRVKLPPSDGKFRVGLAWAGSPGFVADHTRSLHLQQLAPFASLPNVKFHSIQKGPPADQLKNIPPGMDVIDLGPQLDDFADTAAVMSLMDLIVTSDTSIPHLAGALGRPTWLMLQAIPDWRWLLHRDDSPWYPSLKLFRQSSPGDWTGVIARVTTALSDISKT